MSNSIALNVEWGGVICSSSIQCPGHDIIAQSTMCDLSFWNTKILEDKEQNIIFHLSVLFIIFYMLVSETVFAVAVSGMSALNKS